MKPGGTEGGEGPFFFGLGLVLAALGVYLFFDSVDVTSGGQGVISGYLSGNNGMMGGWESTSKGVIFVPMMVGVVVLFYDASKKLGWALLWVGLAVIFLEIISRIRFQFSMKTSHLILLLGMMAGGVGMMMRGLREQKQDRNLPE